MWARSERSKRTDRRRARFSMAFMPGSSSPRRVAGPRSRAVLSQLTRIDLSDAAFPYLGVREAEVAGVRCRLMRVGFVGEIGYEIHLPAHDAAAGWNALPSAGN